MGPDASHGDGRIRRLSAKGISQSRFCAHRVYHGKNRQKRLHGPESGSESSQAGQPARRYARAQPGPASGLGAAAAAHAAESAAQDFLRHASGYQSADHGVDHEWTGALDPDLSALLAEDVSRPFAIHGRADEALSPPQAPGG